MANIISVAKYILEQRGAMTTMKLQKLCYYSQAWSLAWDDKPLFDEDFQAWANGPVCPELFRWHKGKFAISPYYFHSHFLAFQNEKRAKEFLNNFRDLIEQAGDLI